MENVVTEILKSLATGGPVAIVLGVVCYSLWNQNQKLMDRIAQQQTKMLKLAVRVQRAVEALAGLRRPEIEEDLSDDE